MRAAWFAADRHGRARPGHPRLADARQVVDARHKAGEHDGCANAPAISVRRPLRSIGYSSGPTEVCPDHQLIAIARDDDTTFGILHSRFHEAWSLRLGTWLGVGNDPRYTPTTTFETFPFPAGLTPNIPAADTPPTRARSASPPPRRRSTTFGAPGSIRPIWSRSSPRSRRPPRRARRRAAIPTASCRSNVEAAVKLKERTLTNLYNQRPRWLTDAHEALDRAVAAAYGWPEDIATDDALQRLLALNLERAAAQRKTDDEGEAG